MDEFGESTNGKGSMIEIGTVVDYKGFDLIGIVVKITNNLITSRLLSGSEITDKISNFKRI